MKKALILLSSLFLFMHTHAQQVSQYTMYMLNNAMYNPAYVGLEDQVSFIGMYRSQWVNLEGSPSQQYFGIDLPLYFINGGGGLQIQNENLGARKSTSFIASGDYHFVLPSRAVLSGGLGLGYTQMVWNGASLQTPEGNYEDGIIEHEDDILPSSRQTGVGGKLNVGLFYSSEQLEAGLSVENVLSNTLQFDNVELPLNRSFYVHLKYNWMLNQSIVLSPQALVKSDLKEHQLDFSLIMKYNGSIFGGLGLRGYNSNTLDAASLLAGIRFNNGLKIMYAYDYAISELNTVHQGSHEIMLNYTLQKKIGKGKWPKIIYNPRFL